MKLSKSLLGAIAIGVTMSAMTSCNNPSTDISDLNPESTIPSRLERGETMESNHLVNPEDLLKKVCVPFEGEYCPACGLG